MDCRVSDVLPRKVIEYFSYLLRIVKWSPTWRQRKGIVKIIICIPWWHSEPLRKKMVVKVKVGYFPSQDVLGIPGGTRVKNHSLVSLLRTAKPTGCTDATRTTGCVWWNSGRVQGLYIFSLWSGSSELANTTTQWSRIPPSAQWAWKTEVKSRFHSRIHVE